MAVNVSPEYVHAELKFQNSKTEEEKLDALEEMLSTMPGHKGAESLRAQLRTRYKKLKEKLETRSKKSGGRGKPTIRKEDMQAIIVGFPNTGKSSLFKALTDNKNVIISDIPFTTYEPLVGMMFYDDVKIQLIDSPPFPNEEKNILHTADTILIAIDNLEQIEKSEDYLTKASGTRIYLYLKIDLLNEVEKRKLNATLKSKYRNIDYFLINANKPNPLELNELKKKIFQTFPIIRVYMKEPRKEPSKIPMIAPIGSTVKDIAEKILKGLSKKIKRTKIWGPSSKFPGQGVGIEQTLKDKDIVEFQTE